MRRRSNWHLIPAKDAVGEWVRYCSWTERTKFLIKSVDLVNNKIKGIYVTEGKRIPDTTFNLCKGIVTKKMNNYWYIIEDERLDFSLDDKLFEI